EGEYDRAIGELNRTPWGMKAIRLSIAIGDESDYNEPELLKFSNQEKVGLLKAHTPEELLNFIKWASTEATLGSSRSKSQDLTGAAGNVVLSPPPPTITSSTEPF
ncbi:MAG: tellurium resistance protein, partial [Methanomicrobiales archaeon]|nr:tellurium resistance protein [Methanomicrobiales archaeon]